MTFAESRDKLIARLAREDERDRILRIVADHVHRSATYGGLDTGDLVRELEQAGYPLPETTTGEAP